MRKRMFAKHVRTEEREVNEMPVRTFFIRQQFRGIRSVDAGGEIPVFRIGRDRKWRFPAFFAETQRFQDTRRW